MKSNLTKHELRTLIDFNEKFQDEFLKFGRAVYYRGRFNEEFDKRTFMFFTLLNIARVAEYSARHSPQLGFKLSEQGFEILISAIKIVGQWKMNRPIRDDEDWNIVLLENHPTFIFYEQEETHLIDILLEELKRTEIEIDFENHSSLIKIVEGYRLAISKKENNEKKKRILKEVSLKNPHSLQPIEESREMFKKLIDEEFFVEGGNFTPSVWMTGHPEFFRTRAFVEYQFNSNWIEFFLEDSENLNQSQLLGLYFKGLFQTFSLFVWQLPELDIKDSFHQLSECLLKDWELWKEKTSDFERRFSFCEEFLKSICDVESICLTDDFSKHLSHPEWEEKIRPTGISFMNLAKEHFKSIS